jgi:hypothetical protein
MKTIRAFVNGDVKPGDLFHDVECDITYDIVSVDQWGGPYAIMQCEPWPWYKYLWKPIAARFPDFRKSTLHRVNWQVTSTFHSNLGAAMQIATNENEIERLKHLLRAARGILQHHRADYPDEIDDALEQKEQ